MHDLEMSPFEARLAKRLARYASIEPRPANARQIAHATMAAKRRSRLGATWSAMRRPLRLAIVAALLASLLVGTWLVGSRLLFPTQIVDRRSTEPPSSFIVAGPATEDLRSRWLADVGSIPSIGNGSGPVTLTIDPTGSVLSLANLAPGASFASRSTVAGDVLKLELLNAGAGCAAGAQGEYHQTQSADRSRLTLEVITDACRSRSDALSRSWDRTLVGPTTVGAGLVDSMEPNFWIRLPDANYESRTLDDFIEVTDPSTGGGLVVMKNPQGFADSCNPNQVRYPYKPGASAFVDYFRQNQAFVVVSATPLTIDGHKAIHLVLAARVVGAPCPGADLYAYTPKACDCHFFSGDDNLYLVDVDSDTFMFELPLASDPATDLPVIQSIRIPYTPGAPGT
jgi:hypothetical protein